jgi:hypothetical protein
MMNLNGFIFMSRKPESQTSVLQFFILQINHIFEVTINERKTQFGIPTLAHESNVRWVSCEHNIHRRFGVASIMEVP